MRRIPFALFVFWTSVGLVISGHADWVRPFWEVSLGLFVIAFCWGWLETLHEAYLGPMRRASESRRNHRKWEREQRKRDRELERRTAESIARREIETDERRRNAQARGLPAPSQAQLEAARAERRQADYEARRTRLEEAYRRARTHWESSGMNPILIRRKLNELERDYRRGLEELQRMLM